MVHGYTLSQLVIYLFYGKFEDPEPKGFIDSVILVGPIFHSVLVAVMIMMLVLSVRKKLATAGGGVVPDQGLTVQNFFEVLMSMILGFMEDIIGHHYRRYVPLILSLWIFILFSNFLGLIPFFAPPTGTYANTFALALVVFCATHYYGVREHGISYFKHFLSPIWPPTVIFIIMMPIYLTIELIGHFARIVSLSIRLMANLFADHTVVAIFLSLTAPLIPSFFMGLGVIVCVLQAFIFSMLTIIYIALATSEEEEH